MTTLTLPAVFMRGGTSKAVMFHQRDLPAERTDWDRLFLSAMGSPDPYGRQLNGMGGGISSAIARALGAREIYVHYRSGIGTSKLKIPAAARGTARNMNTVAKLAEWATI